MSRIGLLLPDGRNRRLIEEALTHHDLDIEVVAATEISDTPVDVLLAEPRSLLEALTAARPPGPGAAAGSGHRPPIMLLTRASERAALPATVVDAADEIVTVPAPQRELLDRVTRLAGRHRQVRGDEQRLMREHLAHISHELRTPLQCVLAYAELLQDEGLEPGQDELLDSIVRGGKRMLDLVNELLEKGRAEAGHLPDTAVVDVAETISATVGAIRPLAGQRHLTVTVPEATAAGPSVHADPVYLHRILINLMSNAIKYNREHGAVGVAVRAGPEHVEIDIIDTGPGIPAGELGQIFEPYHRLPGSSATGTGLGLPYARMLAQRMGGTITVSSRPGEGSTFTLSLPRADTR